MPLNAPQTVPGLQSWAGFYGGNVAAPPTSFSVFGAQQQGAPPAPGVPYSGGWTNPQTWANYYGGNFGFQAPQNAGTPAGALAAERQNPNDPALLGWEQDFGNPQSILQQSKNWAQSLGAPPTNGQYNQGTGGWANPASWAAYYGGTEGFTAPPNAGTPAAALAAAAALSHSSPLDPNLLGWEQDFGAPGNILGSVPNWAASLGAPPTNGNFNQGIGAWESPLAWAAYYGGIQGYPQPVDNTLQAAQNFAGITNKNDPSLLGWELDYGNPQTVVSVLEAQQQAQQAAQQPPPTGTYQQQLAAYNAQVAADNAQLAAFQQQQAQDQAQADSILTQEQAVQAALQNPSLSPTERLAFQAELEGFQAQEGQYTGLVGTLAGEATSEQAQIAALSPPVQPPPTIPGIVSPPTGINATGFGGTIPIQPGGESALALSIGLPANTSPLEVQATEIANASGAGQGFIQLIESNLRQGFPPLTNVFTPLRGPAGISGTAGVGGEGQVGAGTLPFPTLDLSGPSIFPGANQPGGFDLGFNESRPGQPGGFQPSIGNIPGGIGVFGPSPAQFNEPSLGGSLAEEVAAAVQGLGTSDLAFSGPPEIGAPPTDLTTLFDPFSGVQYPTTPPPVFAPESPSVMLPPLPPDMNLPQPTPLSPSQQPGVTQLPEITVTPEQPIPPSVIQQMPEQLPVYNPPPELASPEFGPPALPSVFDTGVPSISFLNVPQQFGLAQSAFDLGQGFGGGSLDQQLTQLPPEVFPPQGRPSDAARQPNNIAETAIARFGLSPTLRQIVSLVPQDQRADLTGVEGADVPIDLTKPLEPQLQAALGYFTTQVVLGKLRGAGVSTDVIQGAVRGAPQLQGQYPYNPPMSTGYADTAPAPIPPQNIPAPQQQPTPAPMDMGPQPWLYPPELLDVDRQVPIGPINAPGGQPPLAFIMHNTEGGGFSPQTAEQNLAGESQSVAGVNQANTRNGVAVGPQYVTDRAGNIYPGGTGAYSILNETIDGQYGTGEPLLGEGAPLLGNLNTVGMENITGGWDVNTQAQIASAAQFIRENYPDTPIFAHPDVNPGHKQETEGASLVDAINAERAYIPLPQPRPAAADYAMQTPLNIGANYQPGGIVTYDQGSNALASFGYQGPTGGAGLATENPFTLGQDYTVNASHFDSGPTAGGQDAATTYGISLPVSWNSVGKNLGWFLVTGADGRTAIVQNIDQGPNMTNSAAQNKGADITLPLMNYLWGGQDKTQTPAGILHLTWLGNSQRAAIAAAQQYNAPILGASTPH